MSEEADSLIVNEESRAGQGEQKSGGINEMKPSHILDKGDVTDKVLYFGGIIVLVILVIAIIAVSASGSEKFLDGVKSKISALKSKFGGSERLSGQKYNYMK